MLLGDHLAACMREANRVAGSSGAQHVFSAAVQRDPDLRAQAQARLAALAGIHENRCFISKNHRTALKEALKDA